MNKKTTILFQCLAATALATGLCMSAHASEAVASDELHPAAKLREIEQKASAYDFAVRKNEVLQQDINQLRLALASAQSQLNEVKNRYTPGRLLDLERKALSYAYLKDKTEDQERRITEVERQLAEEKCLTTLLSQENEKMKQEITRAKVKESEYKDHVARLRETIDQLRQGNYEFYEIKEGDTLATIAALPMIYDDASKSELLRQANARRVEDLDRLKAGEVLIVPRFRSSGKYEW